MNTNKPDIWIEKKALDYKFASGINTTTVEQENKTDLVPLYIHPVKEQKCIVKDCENHSHEGGFVGDLCKPCHQFITTGEGVYSQAYRNSHPVKELTDEEIMELISKVSFASGYLNGNLIRFARAILRKAQEK